MTGLFTALPFDPATLDFDASASTYVQVAEHEKAFAPVLEHVAKHLVDTPKGNTSHSFAIQGAKKRQSIWERPALEGKTTSATTTKLLAGVGLHRFEWQSHQLYCLRQLIGTPVGTDCGTSHMENLILFAPRPRAEALLQEFVEVIVAQAQATAKGFFRLYRFQVERSSWREAHKVRARPVESVVLSRDVKAKLLADLDNFCSPTTEAYYAQHGIPYKRSYLFHGVPGTGKTSMIQAIAGRYDRNLYFLQPTHPRMTDDALRSAMEDVPANSVVVVEDIDALFDKHRQNKVDKSPLTFSGLLNALDGVGGGDGTLVIVTTNFRDQLDDALVRSGRLDVHVAFDFATASQMEDMFACFYPEADAALAAAFASTLVAVLEDRAVSMAALQHYFVGQRFASAEEAVANVMEVVRSVDERKRSDEVDEALQVKTEEVEATKEVEP